MENRNRKKKLHTLEFGTDSDDEETDNMRFSLNNTSRTPHRFIGLKKMPYKHKSIGQRKLGK